MGSSRSRMSGSTNSARASDTRMRQPAPTPHPHRIAVVQPLALAERDAPPPAGNECQLLKLGCICSILKQQLPLHMALA